MLAFARRQRSERRPLLLAAELRQSAQLLRSTLPSSVELHTALDAAAPAVVGDSVQIEQVVFNLCINARDAIRGAGAVRIGLGSAAIEGVCASCRAPLRGHWVVLSVDDNGSGVSDAVRERMFEPFYTTKPVGSGSGMGLAMVHGIVHDHGGHLLVDPVEPRGTSFRVLLPPAQSLPEHDGHHSAAVLDRVFRLLPLRVRGQGEEGGGERAGCDERRTCVMVHAGDSWKMGRTKRRATRER